MKRFLLFMIMILLLTGCGAAETVTEPVPAPGETTAVVTEAAAATEETTAPTETEPADEHFFLTFVGDCTFGASPSNYYAGVGFLKTVGQDYGYPFRKVMEWFGQDSCTFLNLEGPLTDTGNPMEKKHTFRGPVEYVRILTENSVEAVTIANNHTMTTEARDMIPQ